MESPLKVSAWFITDEYLTMCCHVVARHYIDADNTFPSLEAFSNDMTLAFAFHCPQAFSYFIKFSTDGTLPLGSKQVILDIIRSEKPEFMVGAGSGLFIPKSPTT